MGINRTFAEDFRERRYVLQFGQSLIIGGHPALDGRLSSEVLSLAPAFSSISRKRRKSSGQVCREPDVAAVIEHESRVFLLVDRPLEGCKARLAHCGSEIEVPVVTAAKCKSLIC